MLDQGRHLRRKLCRIVEDHAALVRQDVYRLGDDIGLDENGFGVLLAADVLATEGAKFDKQSLVRQRIAAGGYVAGFAMADIVRATYYVTSAADMDAVFTVCGEVLGDIRPAATILVVAGLYKPEMKIEIEVTAKRRAT